MTKILLIYNYLPFYLKILNKKYVLLNYIKKYKYNSLIIYIIKVCNMKKKGKYNQRN